MVFMKDNDNYMFRLSFLSHLQVVQPEDGLKRKAETCSYYLL
jgi:hypothetical protein